ncbi:MAG: SDR family NAD(P)-dependent oxidoreductase [Clostridium sp.]|nr:SDR family NAD(P)-dependent oxidoreductase [Clostridium sp.]
MKSIIITGASGGVGSAFARLIASDYDFVAICGYKNSKKLSELEAGIMTDKTKAENNTPYQEQQLQDTIQQNKKCVCRKFVGDVGDYNFVSNMVTAVFKEAGGIDALVNIAGISHIGLLTDVTPELWSSIMSTNLTSIYNTCHCVVPHMVHAKAGKIINISSVWGLTGASCEVAYSAAKGGVNSFSKALAKELAPSNISVNAIALGAIDTEMNRHLSCEERTALENEIPYGKMAAPEEAATFIKRILDMPPYFTGEVVKFDGGWI